MAEALQPTDLGPDRGGDDQRDAPERLGATGMSEGATTSRRHPSGARSDRSHAHTARLRTQSAAISRAPNWRTSFCKASVVGWISPTHRTSCVSVPVTATAIEALWTSRPTYFMLPMIALQAWWL
jgi:hypothetical protein